MSEPNKLSVSVNAQQQDNALRPKASRMITHERVADWIRKQELDDYTTQGLIELSSRYPIGALVSFRRNFNLMIQRVRAKKKKEQIGEVQDAKSNEVQQEVPNLFRNAVSLDDFTQFDFQGQESSGPQDDAGEAGNQETPSEEDQWG